MWTLESEPGDEVQVDFDEALPRYVTVLDAAFSRALEECEFEFIHSLLRVRSMQDAGWDPFETTARAIPLMAQLHRSIPEDAENFDAARHLQLWTYGHIVEAAEPYAILADMLDIANGGRFRGHRFQRDMNTGDKLLALDRLANAATLSDATGPIHEIWDRDLRNAVFHAEYSLHGGEVRIFDPVRAYSHDEFMRLINRALAYIQGVLALRASYIQSYPAAKLIPVHRDWPDPTEKAAVIVRAGHGVVGLKHALTREQREAGGIQWRLGVFYPDEVARLDADPELAQLPARAE